MLMNFIHAIAIIMAGSDMKEILDGTIGSSDKMLTGKKYTQNFRAFRMLVEGVLRSVVLIKGVTSHLFDSSNYSKLEQAVAGLRRCGRTILSRQSS